MKKDSVRENLRKWLKQAGYNLKEASILLGKNHAFLSQFVNKESPRELSEHQILTLAHLTKRSPEDFRITPLPTKERLANQTTNVNEPVIIQTIRPILSMLEMESGIKMDESLRSMLEQGLYDVCLRHLGKGLRLGNASFMADFVEEFNRINSEWMATRH